MIDRELSRLAKGIRSKLASIDIERLTDDAADFEASYRAAFDASSPGNPPPGLTYMNQRVSEARSALTNATTERERLIRQLAVCERLTSGPDREKAATEDVHKATDRIAATEQARKKATAEIGRLQTMLDDQAVIDGVAFSVQMKAIAADMGIDDFAGGATITVRQSDKAAILADAVARARQKLPGLDREQRAAEDELRYTRQRHEAAQLDVLELAHGNALQIYILNFADYRAGHRAVYGRDPQPFDYASLADEETDDMRLMRVVRAT